MMKLTSANMFAHGCCMVIAAIKTAVRTSLKAVMELGIFTITIRSVHRIRC